MVFLSGLRSVKRSLLLEINNNIRFISDFTPPKVLRSNTIANLTQGQFSHIVLSKDKNGYKAYVTECFTTVKPTLDEAIQCILEQLYDARYALDYACSIA